MQTKSTTLIINYIILPGTQISTQTHHGEIKICTFHIPVGFIFPFSGSPTSSRYIKTVKRNLFPIDVAMYTHKYYNLNSGIYIIFFIFYLRFITHFNQFIFHTHGYRYYRVALEVAAFLRPNVIYPCRYICMT